MGFLLHSLNYKTTILYFKIILVYLSSSVLVSIDFDTKKINYKLYVQTSEIINKCNISSTLNNY